MDDTTKPDGNPDNSTTEVEFEGDSINNGDNNHLESGRGQQQPPEIPIIPTWRLIVLSIRYVAES